MSKTFSVREIKEGIKHDLGLDDIDESYVATPKDYDLNTELVSKKTKLAHDEIYNEYVETLNSTSAKLDAVDRSLAKSSSSALRSLKQDEVYNRNAVYLHELFFANISDVHSEVSYDSMAFMRLTRDFGTFDDWQWDLMGCGMANREGWVVTAYDVFLRRYMNFVIDGHDAGIPIGCIPIVVVDVWAHSYYRDYVNDKERYLKSMMMELNWNIIEARIDKAELIAKVLER